MGVFNQVVKVVLDAAKFLKQIVVRRLGFKMGGANPMVNFYAKLDIVRKPRKYAFGFQLKGGSLKTIAASLFKNIFKAMVNAAKKTLSALKKKIFRMEEESLEVERQAEEMEQRALEEAREM